jgi:putative colanic acid biosynthesis UDP-glucose lipid carrier transferase
VSSNKVFTFNINTYSSIYRFLDLSVFFICFELAAWFHGAPGGQELLIAPLIISLAFLYIAESFGLYRSWRVGHFSEMILSLFVCISISFFLAVMLAFLLKESESFSRLTIVLWFFLSCFFTFLWRLLKRQYIRASHKAGFNIKQVAIVGATESAKNLLAEIKKRDELGYELAGVFDDRSPARLSAGLLQEYKGKVDEAVVQARNGQIDILFIALPLKAEKRIADILLRLGDTTVDVHYIPDFLISSLLRSRFTNVGDVDVLSVFESPYLGAKEWIKRTEDILISAMILCLISVPLLIIAIAVKVTSPGPVLFKQRRYGLRGEEIMVWKFRSMCVMEDSDKVVQATKGDARVTKLGHFLRRTSLDELPQFFNVLAGTMSIVGPRPHAVAHNEEYRGKVRFYMLRHKVKPGVTGWAQINGWRGETDTLDKMENRVKFDLLYIKNWSVWLDLKIILLTVFKGFTNPNAY